MTRMQLHLDEATHEALRDLARSRHVSVSALAEEILGEYLGAHRNGVPASITEFTFIGSGRSGHHNISERYDEALCEDFLSTD